MKNLKLITGVFLTALLTFTSCQDEISEETGQNTTTNANTANSQTATNLKRSAMLDGSFDDFLDGVSCATVLFPVTATVNNTEVTLVSESDYQTVTAILAEFNTDEDNVTLQFPFSLQLSNYTEVVISNQSEFDAVINACEAAENQAEDALSCIDIQFPMTILTYSLNLDQTGSVVLESEEQLFTYINNFDENELFTVSYPITAVTAGEVTTTIASDSELQNSVQECMDHEDEMEEAEENLNALEEILVNNIFKIESFVNSGIDTANDYAEFTIDFANDLTMVAENTVNTTIEDVEGTYEVTSETEVFLNLNFSGNATFTLLNQNWEVTSFSNNSVSLQSTTNTAITLVLNTVN